MNQKQLEQKIIRLHKSSTEVQSVLEAEFGKEFFNRDITERINGWEDMLAETGLPDIPEFTELPERLRNHFKKYYRCVVMTEAYNEGEKMDIYNKDEYRHYPYFATNSGPSAFAFLNSSYDLAYAYAGSGSRLSFKSEKLANIAGTKHADIYREYLES